MQLCGTLLQAGTGLSGTTLLWCSIMLHQALCKDRVVHELFWLAICMADMLRTSEEDRPPAQAAQQLTSQELARRAQQAYVASAVELRWLAGRLQQDYAVCANRHPAKGAPAYVAAWALMFNINKLLPIVLAKLCSHQVAAEDSSDAPVQLPSSALLQQLLPLALRIAHVMQHCHVQAIHTGSARDSTSPVDVDNVQLVRGLLRAVVGVQDSMHSAASITASSVAITAAYTAAWQPYAAHWTSQLEAYARSDAMGPANSRIDMMRAVLRLASAAAWDPRQGICCADYEGQSGRPYAGLCHSARRGSWFCCAAAAVRPDVQQHEAGCSSHRSGVQSHVLELDKLGSCIYAAPPEWCQR